MQNSQPTKIQPTDGNKNLNDIIYEAHYAMLNAQIERIPSMNRINRIKRTAPDPYFSTDNSQIKK
jgi:hypothetical protein